MTTMSADQEQPDRAEPTTLVEAFARFNMTVDHALDLARRCVEGYDGGDYEYDQGDAVVVAYDDLHNLARVALASMALCRRGVAPAEREEWQALVDADMLDKLPIEAHIASVRHLAQRLLDVTADA